MSTTFIIKEDAAGLWCVWLDEAVLVDRLKLPAAIQDAGRRAREHHRTTGEYTALELDVCGDRSVIGEYGALDSHAPIRENAWPERPPAKVA